MASSHPRAQRAVDKPTPFIVAEHLELRVHLRLHRSLAEDLGTPSVDGAHVCRVELARCGLEARTLDRIGRSLVRPVQLGPEPEAKLSGGLVRERDRHGSGQSATTGAHEPDHPADQLRGLASSRGRLDPQRGFEVLPDPAARFGVVHWTSLRATLCSSSDPHTTR